MGCTELPEGLIRGCVDFICAVSLCQGHDRRYDARLEHLNEPIIHKELAYNGGVHSLPAERLRPEWSLGKRCQAYPRREHQEGPYERRGNVNDLKQQQGHSEDTCR